MSQRAWQVFPVQAGHTFCTGPESSGNPAHTPPCHCPGCSTHQISGSHSHCRSSARSARCCIETDYHIIFLGCHLVVLLTDELVEEGEVGAVESVPAHRAGHAVFMVIFSTGYHAVSDNRPAADATCSLLALTGDLLIFAKLIAVFTSSEHFPQTNLLSRVIILPSMTSSQWLHL